MGLDLRQVLALARRWWWLIVLLPALSGATAYWVGSNRTPLYSATATLLVNRAPSTIADLTDTRTGAALAVTYQNLVVIDPVLQPVIDDLGLPSSATALKGRVSASATGNTQLLRISVVDSDPRAAAAIANAVATQFSTYIQAQTLAFVGPSRNALQTLIDGKQADLAVIKADLARVGVDGFDPGTAQVEDWRAESMRLEGEITSLLVETQNMDLEAAALQTQVTLAVPAAPTWTPFAPRTRFYTQVAVFFGLIFAAGVVLVLEYLDNTARPHPQFATVYGVPLLANVREAQGVKPGAGQLFMLAAPNAPNAESIRVLRTNLEFAAATKEIVTVALTSSGPGEGKTTVAANLAVATAQAGLTTMLIDADMRRPKQHRVWDLPHDRGLSTLLSRPDVPWQSVAHEPLPNLQVIPCGPIPPNPAELLSLDRFRNLLADIGAHVDFIIVDTPPLLAVSDTMVIASVVDAVVVVARSNTTRIEALRATIDLLRERGVRVAGVVLNRDRARQGSGYYYYSIYSKDYHYGTRAADDRSLGGRLRRLTRRGDD